MFEWFESNHSNYSNGRVWLLDVVMTDTKMSTEAVPPTRRWIGAVLSGGSTIGAGIAVSWDSPMWLLVIVLAPGAVVTSIAGISVAFAQARRDLAIARIAKDNALAHRLILDTRANLLARSVDYSLSDKQRRNAMTAWKRFAP